DRICCALAIEAVGRAWVVAEPRQRRLDAVDELGFTRRGRRSVIFAIIIRGSVGIGFRGTRDETDACANGGAGSNAPAASDNAPDDRADHAALHATPHALPHAR